MIAGQGFRNSVVLHDHEGNAIGQQPILIRATLIHSVKTKGRRDAASHRTDSMCRNEPGVSIARNTNVSANTAFILNPIPSGRHEYNGRDFQLYPEAIAARYRLVP